MPKKWLCSLAVGAGLAIAPGDRAAAQNPDNELLLQSFTSGSIASVLTQIFIPNVTFPAGTGFDIRQFRGPFQPLGASLFYQVASSTVMNGPLTLTPNILLAPNTLYALVLEVDPSSSPAPNASVDLNFAGGTIYTRSNAASVWVDQNVDIAGFRVTTTAVTASPEPASMTLMATGMFGVASWARRRKKQAAA